MQEELWEVGTYLNPGNSGFAEMLKSDYVDKTGLILKRSIPEHPIYRYNAFTTGSG